MPAHRIHKTTTEAAIRECAEMGLTSAQIADRLGTSLHMLRQTLCVLGIKTKGNARPPTRPTHTANNPFNR